MNTQGTSMSQIYHFIGIGGIGMSGLARILLAKNVPVSGSDLLVGPVVQALIDAGATVHKGHSAHLITPEMTVIYGSDIQPTNPEYQAALEMKCPILHRSELLSLLIRDCRSFAVTGTHGKTTVSALLSTVLFEAGLDPSFAVGGVLPQFNGNARYGAGNDFVLEADESDGTFLKYHPYGAIVTNIDNDHLNNYEGSEEVLVRSFGTFMSQVISPSHLFWCAEDAHLRTLNGPGQSYGFGEACDWRASNVRQEGFKLVFDLEGGGKTFHNIELPLIGDHNVLNAIAVFGLAVTLGVDDSAIRKAFKSFKGVTRRCDVKGTMNGVLVLDDYAHHPTEIHTTLRAIRQAIGERRLVAVFQPHRYSRTKDCMGLYGNIFDDADELLITDIYGAGETPLENVSCLEIMEEVRTRSSIPIQYVPRSALSHQLTHFVQPHDVVVTLGAGDITKLGVDLIASLEKHSGCRLKIGLIFGGSFSEHEVSIRSADHFRQSLRPEYYAIENFGVTREGIWIGGDTAREKLEAGALDDQNRPLHERTSQSALSGDIVKAIAKCDVLIPVLHGPYGEDGTVQGLSETMGKAYVGCDHRSAAVCMDKALSKKIASLRGIKTLPFIDFSIAEWLNERESLLEAIKTNLTLPVFVKPAHLGSSVGLKKVIDFDQLEEAIRFAFSFDNNLVVENGVVGREIEFAVLGNDDIQAFPPGEVLADGAVYDYQAKYSSEGIKTTPRAELSAALVDEGKKLATRVYRALGCSGLARVDFFLDQNGTYWFNEINPMPGFTATSLYPQICALNGLDAPSLMDRLVILALHMKRRQDRINRGAPLALNGSFSTIKEYSRKISAPEYKNVQNNFAPTG
jgi:UDP-N-acetylmuramate--alanine ligase